MDEQNLQERWRERGGALIKSTRDVWERYNRISGGALFSRAARLAGLCAIGFFLARAEIAFGARPMAIALLCAVRDGGAAAVLGMALCTLLEDGAGGIGVIMAITAWLIRVIGEQILQARQGDGETIEESEYGGGAALRVTLGCAAAAASGIWTLIRGGFLFYDLLAMLLTIALQPPLILAYRFAFSSDSRYSVRAECGQMVLAMSVLISLTSLRILGFSPAVSVGYFLTLYIARTGGTMRGGIAGFLFGFLCRPSLAPIMGVGGLVCGLLKRRDAAFAATMALLAGMACGFYAEGALSLLMTVPELILGLACALPLLRMPKPPQIFTYAVSTSPDPGALERGEVARNSEKKGRERLEALTETLESLSEVFYHLSDRMKKPPAAEVRRLCEKCMRRSCIKCSLSTVCWLREQASTQDALNAMTTAVCREGMLSVADLPQYLRERCKSLPQIVTEVNNSHIDMLEQAARLDKLEVFALDYHAMAELLVHACRMHAAETEPNEELGRRLKHTAQCMGVGNTSISVVGKRRLQVMAGGVDPSQIRLSPNRIREGFGEAMGVKLTPPIFDYDGGYVTMSLTSARRYSIEWAKSGCEKREESISGDSAVLFENQEDYAYALISDGMGSGREAALTSKMCTVFLRTMLAAGNPKSVAIEMLNNFIRNKNMECFATVDLLEIDLLDGHACFVKSGAAPSYVLRDGKLFRIASRTMPIGITREIRAEEVRFELEAGDVVVMMSDGVASDSISCETAEGLAHGESDAAAGIGASLWLADMLTFEWEEGETIGGMCEKILRTAQSINRRADDMTVAMIKIEAIEG